MMNARDTIYYGDTKEEFKNIPVDEIANTIEKSKEVIRESKSGRHRLLKVIINGKTIYVFNRSKHGIVNYYGEEYHLFLTKKVANEKYIRGAY